MRLLCYLAWSPKRMHVHLQGAAGGASTACIAGACADSLPVAPALRNTLDSFRHCRPSPCTRVPPRASACSLMCQSVLTVSKYSVPLQQRALRGVAGVDRPLADAQAGDLLVATAEGAQTLWLEVLERRQRPAAPPASDTLAEASSAGEAASAHGDGSSYAESDRGGGNSAAQAAEPLLVAACCGERLELHVKGPKCLLLRHVGTSLPAQAQRGTRLGSDTVSKHPTCRRSCPAPAVQSASA